MKNRILNIALLCLCFGSATAVHSQTNKAVWGDQGDGTFANPVLNADFSDPDIIRVGEKYYMVASDFHFMGMQLLVSDDMVNWSYLTQLYSRLDYPGWDNNKHYGGGSWAPSIRYHDGKFWVFFCTPDEGLFMTNAVDPAGPWSPLVQVSNVPKWEDPCPFWDEDGKAYLGRSRHGAGPIIVHRMSPDGTKLLDDGVTVYSGPVAEGTKFMKRDGYYYLSIPEGGVGQGWQTVLRSRNIYGPYERKIVLEQGSTAINGPHQGALVDTPDGEWWFYHFQETHPLGRVVHLQPVTWKDGWPSIGVDLDGNGVGEPVMVCKKPNIKVHSTPYLPAMSDDFSENKLGLQWQFNHNPLDKAYHLTKRGILFDLQKAESFVAARNTLTQKMMGFKGTASVWMDMSKIVDGQHSGMVCMGKNNYLLGVERIDGKSFIYFESDGKVVKTIPFSGKKIELQLQMNALTNTHQFAYRLGETDDFTIIGDSFPMRMGNWKGARVGLFGYNTNAAKGKVTFRNFVYTCDQSQISN